MYVFVACRVGARSTWQGTLRLKFVANKQLHLAHKASDRVRGQRHCRRCAESSQRKAAAQHSHPAKEKEARGAESRVLTANEAVAGTVQLAAVGQIGAARHNQQSAILDPSAIQKVPLCKALYLRVDIHKDTLQDACL